MTESIWKRHRQLMKERGDKMQELMEEYDKTVYYPALKALREECEATGHVRGNFHDNGLGWCWYWCNQCGAAFDKEQYNIIDKE